MNSKVCVHRGFSSSLSALNFEWHNTSVNYSVSLLGKTCKYCTKINLWSSCFWTSSILISLNWQLVTYGFLLPLLSYYVLVFSRKKRKVYNLFAHIFPLLSKSKHRMESGMNRLLSKKSWFVHNAGTSRDCGGVEGYQAHHLSLTVNTTWQYQRFRAELRYHT